jgi:signal peptidase I
MSRARTFLAAVVAVAGGTCAYRVYQRLARFEVSESSMVPTLRPGDRVLTWERTPTRGDIVVFEHPSRPDFWMVKRVIGLPDEHISIENGAVSINGAPLDEPWTIDSTGPDQTWELGAGEAFVLGDARALSAGDSRQTGPIPLDHLDRTVIARYWPDPRPVL